MLLCMCNSALKHMVEYAMALSSSIVEASGLEDEITSKLVKKPNTKSVVWNYFGWPAEMFLSEVKWTSPCVVCVMRLFQQRELTRLTCSDIFKTIMQTFMLAWILLQLHADSV